MAEDVPVTPAATAQTPSAPVQSSASPATPQPLGGGETATSAPALAPSHDAGVAPKTEVAPGESAQPVEQPVSETVLGEAIQAPESTKSEGDKTAGTQASPEAPKEGEGQSAEPAPPPTYEPFAFPEDVPMDEARVSEFTDLLGKFEQESKASHAEVQKFGQQLVDFHTNELKNAVTEMHKYYMTAFERQKTDWKDKVMADPELGGNRFETTINSALSFIRTHGGTEAEQTELRQALNTSGLGNHPAIVRLLARAGKAMGEGVPLIATKPPPNAKSKTEKMYGKAS